MEETFGSDFCLSCSHLSNPKSDHQAQFNSSLKFLHQNRSRLYHWFQTITRRHWIRPPYHNIYIPPPTPPSTPPANEAQTLKNIRTTRLSTVTWETWEIQICFNHIVEYLDYFLCIHFAYNLQLVASTLYLQIHYLYKVVCHYLSCIL